MPPDESFFHRVLDADLRDAAARLLLADWLRGRADPRADGYRWLARRGKYPYRAHNTWDWWTADSANPDEIRLPNPLWETLRVAPNDGFPRCKEWDSRREAEDDVALAAGRLPGMIDREIEPADERGSIALPPAGDPV